MLLHIVPWANNLGAFINSFVRRICLESYYHRCCICLRDHKDVADFFSYQVTSINFSGRNFEISKATKCAILGIFYSNGSFDQIWLAEYKYIHWSFLIIYYICNIHLLDIGFWKFISCHYQPHSVSILTSMYFRVYNLR